ncbi:MAG TPA: tetratricopeptide repeat protein [Pyrinomonadaceae bacterium]|nr:tetratricopeptide repeat protein [Pyrinomonadaceae bacterium]
MKASVRATLKSVPILLFAALASLGTFAQTPVAPQIGKETQALVDSGQAAIERGQYDDALRAFNKAYILANRIPQTAALIQVKIGNVYMMQRKFDAASASFQRAAALDPNYALAQNNLGEVYGEARQYNRALEAFNKAIALDPQLSRARYNIGITYTRMGNLKYAEFVFRVLVRERPNYDLGFDGLAVTIARAGRPREAISFHQKAITLNPREPSYYYNLGLSYLMAGDTAKAGEQQQRLLKIAPELADRLASAIVKRSMR